jgi:hypothetical protein
LAKHSEEWARFESIQLKTRRPGRSKEYPVFLLVGLRVGVASADSVYNFVVGQEVPFLLTSNGLTAIFDCNNGPRGCSALPTAGTGIPLPGVALATSTATLMSIFFSSNATSISLDFSTGGPGLFELFTLENGAPVGFATAMGTVPNGFTFPGGTISLTDGPFNEVLMASTSTPPSFAIENIDVKAVGTPEPGSLLLLGFGLAGVVAFCRRKFAWRQQLFGERLSPQRESLPNL